ncbi:hypothetical protein KR215_005920 [Drosophila sulfurigaster]|nr:hypothetical protein KR215_005920 [Drosophila sulfurigaster]
MTAFRPFTCDDLFKFNNVNFDPLTETYNLTFYTQYLAKWPELFYLAESPNEHIIGYIIGKVESEDDNWHGHVTTLSISPDYRRLGLAALLMKFLENLSEKKHAYFVDLFVRKSNKLAFDIYTKMGYFVFRTIRDYYRGDQDEDAYDMRKALSSDKSLIQPVRDHN